MSALPFAGFNPKPSPWGYNWTSEIAKPSVPEPVTTKEVQTPNHCQPTSPEPEMMANQYANMPAALLNTLKREKKPFTYTPGGVNLNEVLNARLQKRLERKKKYSQEKMSAAEDALPRFDPPKQVIVMPTYNTPLDMYSMENALEALEAQAELVLNDKRPLKEEHYFYETPDPRPPKEEHYFSQTADASQLKEEHYFFETADSRPLKEENYFYETADPRPPKEEYYFYETAYPSLSAPSRSATLPRNHTFRFDDKDVDPGQRVAQSKAFKVLQIITDTEEEQPSDKHERYQDEMRFTGLRESKAIPSKFFHTLQKITGTEEDDEEEPQPKQKQQIAPSRSGTFEKQKQAARPPFMPQQNLPQFTNDSRVAAQPTQPTQPQFNSNPALKRPAAFLPIKTTPGAGFRPVQPPFLSNGPLRKVGNPSGGTDF